VNRFDRDGFKQWCESESWFLPKTVGTRPGVAIQTFPPRSVPAHMRDAAPENTLDLTSFFKDRQLVPEASWRDLEPRISEFLKRMLAERPTMRLFLDAHASIATLAGARLRFKDGADVEVVQRGFNNPGMVWSAVDGLDGPPPVIELEAVGEGKDIAVSVGLTRDTIDKVREYSAANLPALGTIVRVTMEQGAGQAAIHGGQHAATIAARIADAVAAARKPGGKVHLFVAGPNAFSFFLGQQAEAMGECVPYEFDFGGRTDGSYRPTFSI
jgi:hypothetical protein